MDSPPADDVGTPLREHGIIRLEISMDDAAFMRGLEEGGDLDADLQELLDRERALAYAIAERLTIDQLHNQAVDPVFVADVIESAEVGVVERGDGPCLPFEAGEQLLVFRQGRRQDLDRDLAIEAVVSCTPDLAHTAGTDSIDDSAVLRSPSRFQAHSILPVAETAEESYMKCGPVPKSVVGFMAPTIDVESPGRAFGVAYLLRKRGLGGGQHRQPVLRREVVLAVRRDRQPPPQAEQILRNKGRDQGGFDLTRGRSVRETPWK